MEKLDEANVLKRFTTKGGTVVEFSEAEGEELVTVTTPKKLSLTLCDKTQSITISVADSQITLDGNHGKITLNAEKEIRLKTGKAELSMTSGGELLLKGQKIEMSGTMVDVKADGIMALKGAMTKIN